MAEFYLKYGFHIRVTRKVLTIKSRLNAPFISSRKHRQNCAQDFMIDWIVIFITSFSLFSGVFLVESSYLPK